MEVCVQKHKKMNFFFISVAKRQVLTAHLVANFFHNACGEILPLALWKKIDDSNSRKILQDFITHF
jgi:hypothetical protein